MECSKLNQQKLPGMKGGKAGGGPPPEIKAMLDRIQFLENKTTLSPTEQQELDSLKASLPGKPPGGPKGLQGNPQLAGIKLPLGGLAR